MAANRANHSHVSPRTLLLRAYVKDDGEGQPSLIDLRDASSFMTSRLRGSYNVPLELLVPRMFLLPDRATPLGLVVGGPPESQRVRGAAAAGGAKEDIHVAAFLESRGWRVVFCLEASPELWRVAEEMCLLDRGGDPLALARRWPFQPSKLLMEQIRIAEELLLKDRYCSGCQAVNDPGGASSGSVTLPAGQAPTVDAEPGCDGRGLTFRMLDVGCGSGRDLAWLSTRDTAVAVPGSGSDCAAGNTGGGEHKARVRWECVGLDSWHGALQRAAEVLTLGDVAAGRGGVTLHLVQIGPGTSVLKPLPPPAACSGSDSKKAQRQLLLRYLAPAAHQQGQYQQGQVQQGDDSTFTAKINARGGHAAAAGDNCQRQLKAAEAVGTEDGPPPSFDVSELGQFDLLVCVRFLERSFLSAMADLLKPGGVILFSTFVDGPGLRAFGRPQGREHVLQPDELAGSFFGPNQGFEVLRDDVEAIPDGREVSMFCARKRH